MQSVPDVSEHAKTIARLDREGEQERGTLAERLSAMRARMEDWKRRAGPWAAVAFAAVAAAGAGLAVSALVRRATRNRRAPLLGRLVRSIERTKTAARAAKKKAGRYKPRPLPVTLLFALLRAPMARRALAAGAERLAARGGRAVEAAREDDDRQRDAENGKSEARDKGERADKDDKADAAGKSALEEKKPVSKSEKGKAGSGKAAPPEGEGERKAKHTLKELKEAPFREKLRFGAHLFRDAFREFSEDEGLTRAAALAYYTVFSLAPLLVVVIAVAGLAFGADAVRDRILGQIGKLAGSDSAAAIAGLMKKASKPSSSIIATIVGVVTLLIGAGGVFGYLQQTLNKFWGVPERKGSGLWNAVRSRFLSLAMVLGTGFLLMVSLVVSAALSAVGDTLGTEHSPVVGVLFNVLHTVVSFAVVGLLFALIFRYLPDTRIAWRDVWIGAAFTSLLFALGQFLIGLYLGRSAVASVYGGAGSIAIILLWTYYSGLIVFFGAELTQVFAKQWGSRR